jgi:hypothetical protein
VRDFKLFFEEMATRGLKPKCKQLEDVKLDFAEADQDQGIQDAIKDLKTKAR